MTERQELLKRLESLSLAQRDTDGELAAQQTTERETNLPLQQAIAALGEQVDQAELELFSLEQQLEELRATVRRAR